MDFTKSRSKNSLSIPESHFETTYVGEMGCMMLSANPCVLSGVMFQFGEDTPDKVGDHVFALEPDVVRDAVTLPVNENDPVIEVRLVMLIGRLSLARNIVASST